MKIKDPTNRYIRFIHYINIDERYKIRFNVQPWEEIYLIYFNLFSLFDPCFYKFSISKIESVELKFPFNQKHFIKDIRIVIVYSLTI